MKKINYLFVIIGFALFLASCATEKSTVTTTDAPADSKVLMTQQGLESLGEGKYLSDEFIKNHVHVYNSQPVDYNPEGNGSVTTEAESSNGGIRVKESIVRLRGSLPGGTEGQIDSIVRYNTKNISRFRVRYLTERFGFVYIWYYRKTALNNTYYWASNGNQNVTIGGLPFVRTTFDNRLKWDYGLASSIKDEFFLVKSPFGSSSSNKTPPDPKKNPVEEEEKEN